MAKKPTNDSSKGEEKNGLTEWQKRNLDFLKQKEKEKKEQEKLRKELQAQKRARLQAKSTGKKELDEKKRESESATQSKSAKTFSKKTKIKPVKKKSQKKAVVKSKPKTNPLSTKFKRRMTSVLVPAILGIIFSLYLMTPASKIKQVTVDGANRTDSQTVVKASGLADDSYTFSTIFNRSELARSIEKNDVWVKSAKVDYHFPFTFTIKVKEHNIVAYAQTDQGYEPILESGTRLNSLEANDLPEQFTTINLENGKYLSSLIKKLTKMDRNLISEIKVISLAGSKTTSDLLKLDMQDGNIVYVPLSQIDKKLPYYDKIKDNLKDNHVVDMEVGIFATSDEGDDSNQEGETSESSSADDAVPETDPNQDNQPEAESSDSNTNEAANSEQ
ncbi:cell division protein FtsQ/DivIB [Streptococcus dentasini]